ncbi:MAG: hypothetical protein ABJG42_24725 [Vibrio splendidus]
MTYEQQLIQERESELKEKEYLLDWSAAIAENYRRIREKHDHIKFMRERGVEL